MPLDFQMNSVSNSVKPPLNFQMMIIVAIHVFLTQVSFKILIPPFIYINSVALFTNSSFCIKRIEILFRKDHVLPVHNPLFRPQPTFKQKLTNLLPTVTARVVLWSVNLKVGACQLIQRFFSPVFKFLCNLWKFIIQFLKRFCEKILLAIIASCTAVILVLQQLEDQRQNPRYGHLIAYSTAIQFGLFLFSLIIQAIKVKEVKPVLSGANICGLLTNTVSNIISILHVTKKLPFSSDWAVFSILICSTVTTFCEIFKAKIVYTLEWPNSNMNLRFPLIEAKQEASDKVLRPENPVEMKRLIQADILYTLDFPVMNTRFPLIEVAEEELTKVMVIENYLDRERIIQYYSRGAHDRSSDRIHHDLRNVQTFYRK